MIVSGKGLRGFRVEEIIDRRVVGAIMTDADGCFETRVKRMCDFLWNLCRFLLFTIMIGIHEGKTWNKLMLNIKF